MIETGDDTYARDGAVMSRLQHLRFFPLSVASGQGVRLHGSDGRSLLDLTASWGAAALGHGHPDFVAAISAAVAAPAGASLLSSAVEPALALAEVLLENTPGEAPRRVWLGHSGSDANETVMRAVLAATGRPRIMAFAGAYHGGTAGSMAISGHSAQEGIDKAAGLTLVPYPDPYRPFQDDPTGALLLEHIDALLDGDCPGHEVAAFFFEPLQADGGLLVPPQGFFERLAGICARYGILTVCDEVKVGLGRSGRLHCFEHERITPDFVTFGKGLGGGVPISAVVGPADILDHAAAFSMQTLHGNPICAAAARCVLEVILRDDLAGNAARTGAHFQAGLRELSQRFDCIGDVRGRGLAIGVELVKDRKSRAPAPDLAAQVVYRAFELGAVFYYVGMNSNVLELTPPLTLTRAEADEGVAIIAEALEDVTAGRFDATKLEQFQGW